MPPLFVCVGCPDGLPELNSTITSANNSAG